MSDKFLSEQLFEKIVEAVQHGIVSSKQTESSLARENQLMLTSIKDSIGHLKSELHDIKEYQKLQNGRVFKLAETVEGQEKELVSLDKWKSWTTGIATASILLIGTIIALSIYIFQTSVDRINTDISRLEKIK